MDDGLKDQLKQANVIFIWQGCIHKHPIDPEPSPRGCLCLCVRLCVCACACTCSVSMRVVDINQLARDVRGRCESLQTSARDPNRLTGGCISASEGCRPLSPGKNEKQLIAASRRSEPPPEYLCERKKSGEKGCYLLQQIAAIESTQH